MDKHEYEWWLGTIFLQLLGVFISAIGVASAGRISNWLLLVAFILTTLHTIVSGIIRLKRKKK